MKNRDWYKHMVKGGPRREQEVYVEKKTERGYTTMKQEQEATSYQKDPPENRKEPLEIKIR